MEAAKSNIFPSPISSAQQFQTAMFPLCGLIDLCMKRLSTTAIIQLGLSRCGKSTIFNHYNGVKLFGVSPANQDQFDQLGAGGVIDVVYEPRIVTTQAAEANNGVRSVTLIPNFADKGDHTWVDTPGLNDKRRYYQVIGVSYVLKAIFQKVQQVKLIMTVKVDYFRNAPQLFNALRCFKNLFEFETMDPQTKTKLMKSITMAVTKSPANATPDTYVNIMKRLLRSRDDTEYGYRNQLVEIAFLLQYFIENPQQIYLFKVAVVNQDAPPCTLYEEHLSKRQYFQIAQQNQKFKKDHKKTIFKLPFAEDFERMPDPADRPKLRQQIDQRIRSVDVFAKILSQFFEKAIKAKNLFDPNLNFKPQIKLIEQYNAKYNVYSLQFDWIKQTKFQPHFSRGDPNKPLKKGIRLAKAAFKLFKYFNQLPDYNNEDDPSTLQIFMVEYRKHITKIIRVFRDNFCTTFEEERAIIQFLFIMVRACRQFSMLYQINSQQRYDMCMKIKNSFQAILVQKLNVVKKQFIIELHANLNELGKSIKQNKQQIELYLNFLKELPKQQDCQQIESLQQYKQVKRKFIQWQGLSATDPLQTFLSTYESLIQQKKKTQQVINKLNDEEGQDYPPQLNFDFIHQFATIGSTLLSIERSQNIEEDPFAYDRINEPEVQQNIKNGTLKKYLIQQQAYMAKAIFAYIGDVKLVIKTYETLLKHTNEQDYEQIYDLKKNLASYCSKHGKIDKAIDLYQQLMTLCSLGKMCKQYYQTKKALASIPVQQTQKLKSYFNEVKQNTNIDPSDDLKFLQIIKDLEQDYIGPLQRRRENDQQFSQSDDD